MKRLAERLGFAPDLSLVRSLYLLDTTVVEPPEREDEHGIFRVVVDGATVKFIEDGFWVQAIVEGQLSGRRLKQLQDSVQTKLEKLTGAEWTFHVPP